MGELVELNQRLQYLIYIFVIFHGDYSIIVRAWAECNYFGTIYVVIIQKIKCVSTDFKSFWFNVHKAFKNILKPLKAF